MVLADPEQTRLRVMAKQALAVPSALALWQASKAKPQLSDDAALANRKQRLLDVLKACGAIISDLARNYSGAACSR